MGPVAGFDGAKVDARVHLVADVGGLELGLYRALWALDSLTGPTASDDILNLIFSTF